MATMSKIILRPMKLDDVPLIDFWDRQPHVLAATTDDPNQTKAYGETYWSDELKRAASDYQLFVAELDGRAIGVVLIIDPHTDSMHYWGDIEPNLSAIDIWIGSVEDLGKGYGEQMMRRAFQICFSKSSVTAIIIDPLVSNKRACKFYQRLGFVPEERRIFGADECLVHRLTRATWEQRFPND